MSELLIACKALAAMVRDHGEPTVDEVRFIAHAALELGLDVSQNEEVQGVLKTGGDFAALIAGVESKEAREFLFRRIVSATMLDDHINDAEKAYIQNTAKAFGYDGKVVDEFVAWLREGLDWERRGVEILERL